MRRLGFPSSTPPWSDVRKHNDCSKRWAGSSGGVFRAVATGYARLGKADEAFKWLERALRERDGGILELRAGPMYQPLREDPRYVPLLRRIGLSDEQVKALDFYIPIPEVAQ